MAAAAAAFAAPGMASAAASVATQAACCVCGSCASKLCCVDNCSGVNSANIIYFVMWLASALSAFLLYVPTLLHSRSFFIWFSVRKKPSR
jgi:hypothetical protein